MRLCRLNQAKALLSSADLQIQEKNRKVKLKVLPFWAFRRGKRVDRIGPTIDREAVSLNRKRIHRVGGKAHGRCIAFGSYAEKRTCCSYPCKSVEENREEDLPQGRFSFSDKLKKNPGKKGLIT